MAMLVEPNPTLWFCYCQPAGHFLHFKVGRIDAILCALYTHLGVVVAGGRYGAYDVIITDIAHVSIH